MFLCAKVYVDAFSTCRAALGSSTHSLYGFLSSIPALLIGFRMWSGKRHVDCCRCGLCIVYLLYPGQNLAKQRWQHYVKKKISPPFVSRPYVVWPTSTNVGCCEGSECNRHGKRSNCYPRLLLKNNKNKSERKDTCTARVAMSLFWQRNNVRQLILLSPFHPFLYVCWFACHCFGAARRVREVIYRHFDCETWWYN